MIRVGNQTSCWTATPREPFDYALAQGFDAFEWFPDKKPGVGWDETDLDSRARKEIRDAAEALGMRLSVHARWQANLLEPGAYPLIWRDLDLARDLGAVLLNIHLYHEQGLPAFVEALIPLLKRTAEAGLLLAIENTPHHSPEIFNEFFAGLKKQGDGLTGHVGMCLDLGHANLCSATRNDYLGFCDRLDPQVPIVHLHLHENWGDADTHLPLFTGPASRDDSGIRGLVARLKQRNYSGSVILEQWPYPPSLLDQARNRLLSLWTPLPEPDSRTVDNAVNRTADRPSSPGSKPVAGRAHDSGSAPRAQKVQPTVAAPGNDLTAELTAGDRRSRSWREKLDFIRELLAADDRVSHTDQLIDIAIYLRFLGSGEVPCTEDGRHFRPAHHSQISLQIQERLGRLATPENAFVIRKILPWLPSSSPNFRHPEPLTRIRDIAHRNDIDPELKREIKTTLQNKLHRCAGPEDLVTASDLLARITAPGANHAAAFVEQFRIFYDELSEFFNAHSLEQRLAALLPALDAELAALAELFLREKFAATPAGRIAALTALTSLRRGLLAEAGRKPAAESQEFLLADIALEDFAFVLLSEIINDCERQEAGKSWEPEMESLVLAVMNLALSGVAADEVRAIEAELRLWGKDGLSAERDDVLRVKASLLRCRRLAEAFGDRIVALFAQRALVLGRALGVADHAVRVFSESDIRAHIIFQVAKLVSRLLRGMRQRLALPPWDVLVGGRAVGRVKTVDSLAELGSETGQPLVVLLRHAAGDEEIPKAVVGIVLAHEMPHLSHLGIRARQAGVVFAASEESAEFEAVRRFENRTICFEAGSDSLNWKPVAESRPATVRPVEPAPHSVPRTVLTPDCHCLPLDQVTAESAGSKAAGARRLVELSRRAGAGFSTPPAVVIPFGAMEAQLSAQPALATEYHELLRQIDSMPAAEFAAATRRLQQLLQQIGVAYTLTAEVARRFAPDARLAVRSSSNCEDVEGLAGAGLYDSVLNVGPSAVARAVSAVWSSLWTERAALSRKQAAIPHDQAHMAVLIQEMVPADLSFVLHTVNPLSHSADEVYAEIVVGLGDTLALAANRGTPFRFACGKTSGAVRTLAFANFSYASRPEIGGGLRKETVDYSKVALSRDAAVRQKLGQRLGALGSFLQEALGQAQDIEGAIVGDRIWLVQTRPQPGLAPRPI